MAVDYTRLFTILGKYVKHVNLEFAHVAEIAIHQSQIENSMAVAGMGDIVGDFADVAIGIQDNITAWILGDCKNLTDRVLLDPEVLVNDLVFSTTPTVRAVLEKLHRAMVEDSDYLEGSNQASISNVDYTNVFYGNQALSLLFGTVLDGASNPAPDIAAFPYWELYTTLNSTVDLEINCIADSESGNVARGSEGLLVEGGERVGFYSRLVEGSGSVQVSAANNLSIIPAGKLDSWSSGIPVGWTNVGASQDDFGLSVNGVRGTSCVSLTSGGEAWLRLPISTTLLTRRRTYFLWFALKRLTDPSAGTITLKLIDESGDLATVSVGHASITEADWMIFYTNFRVPDTITGSLYIELKVTAPLDATILIDDVCLTPATFYDGFPMAVAAVDQKVIFGDKITADVLGGADGFVFQDFFRKQYRFKLPFSTGFPTIPDSLGV